MKLGPLDLLGILFVILKLVGVITWSWWWVCSPILLSFAVGFLLALVAFGTGIAQGKTRDEIMANIWKF